MTKINRAPRKERLTTNEPEDDDLVLAVDTYGYTRLCLAHDVADHQAMGDLYALRQKEGWSIHGAAAHDSVWVRFGWSLHNAVLRVVYGYVPTDLYDAADDVATKGEVC